MKAAELRDRIQMIAKKKNKKKKDG